MTPVNGHVKAAKDGLDSAKGISGGCPKIIQTLLIVFQEVILVTRCETVGKYEQTIARMLILPLLIRENNYCGPNQIARSFLLFSATDSCRTIR